MNKKLASAKVVTLFLDKALASKLAWPMAVGLGLCPAGAQAGTFHVSPVRIALSQAHPMAELTLQNDGDQATVVQLEAMAWSQVDSKDTYTPSSDLLVTPPIFTVPSGSKQVVRVGLRRPVDPQRELSYRLYLQEIPPPAKPGFQGIQIAMRLGVPIFVAPTAPTLLLLSWQAARAPDGAVEITLTDTGNAHVQVIDFKLSLTDSEQVLATQQASVYLLPGQVRRWVVHPEQVWQGERLHLSARTDMGEVTAEIGLAKP